MILATKGLSHNLYKHEVRVSSSVSSLHASARCFNDAGTSHYLGAIHHLRSGGSNKDIE